MSFPPTFPLTTTTTTLSHPTADVLGLKQRATAVAVLAAHGFAVLSAKPALGITIPTPACLADRDAQEPSPSSSVSSVQLPSPLDATLDLPAVDVVVPGWSPTSIDVEVDRLADRLAAGLLVSEDVDVEVPRGDVEENSAHTLEVPASDVLVEEDIIEDVVEMLPRMMKVFLLDEDVEMLDASEVDVEMVEEDVVEDDVEMLSRMMEALSLDEDVDMVDEDAEDIVEVLTKMMSALTLDEDVEMVEASEVDVVMVERVDGELSDCMGTLTIDEEDVEMVAVEDVMNVDAAGLVSFLLASRFADMTNTYSSFRSLPRR